ncbi:MAG: hypothetical protein IKO42_00020 [Opitutales bacterium]|nr:hypothetical protein [Opitutales bacterium]
MKKILSLTLAAVFAALAVACAPKKDAGKLTIQDAANAAPANAEMFLAVDSPKKLQEEILSQKGAKEFMQASLDSPAAQKFFEAAFENMPEEFKSKINAKTVLDFARAYEQTPEDFFLAVAAATKENSCDIKFIVLKHSLFAKKVKELLEEKKLEKSQKDGFEFYKKADFVVAFKGALLIFADNEEAALKVASDLKLKAPRENSFAASEKFQKLMGLEKNPIVACFIDAKNQPKGNFDGCLFFAYSMQNLNNASGVLKIDLGKKFDEMLAQEDAKLYEVLVKSRLARNSLLKNSLPNSTFALALAVPEITDGLESELLKNMDGDAIENKMVLSILKNAGIKNLCLSLGELDPESISNIQEKTPEAFLKIEAADTDAVFKNEMVLQLLNSPFLSPLKIGEDTVYSGMFNLKIAQASKSCAAASTMKDVEKMMSLARGKGKSLAGNKDAQALVNELPEGDAAEFFIDVKALSLLSNAMQNQVESDLGDRVDADWKTARQYQSAIEKAYKKMLIAGGVKLEPKEITITFKAFAEYDYELGAKLLKEIK